MRARVLLLSLPLVTTLVVGSACVKAHRQDVSIYAFRCGILKTQTQYMLKDTRVGTPMDIPVVFFMIRHGDQWVAYDCGNNVMVARDPVGYWSEPLVKAYTPVMKESEEFKVQIREKLGLEAATLKAVILSHGHLDHAGAVDNLAGTTVPIHLQRRELENVRAELEKYRATGTKTAYIAGDWARIDELNLEPVDGVFDVFGDRSVVAFPTPGHTPGHQSLMVKSGGTVYVLCGDAGYTQENVERSVAPGLAWDVARTIEALYMFKVLEWSNPNVALVPSHDPTWWRDRPMAPQRLTL